MQRLPATPPAPAAGGRLVPGLTAGPLRVDPLAYGPGGSRRRRWSYAAAADDHVAIGAAVVEVTGIAIGFVWALVDGEVVTWERRFPLGRGAWVGPTPQGGAGCRTRRGESVFVDPDGGLRVDVRASGERLRGRIVAQPTTPAVTVTATPGGGWNVTQKEAGQPAAGRVQLGELTFALDGGGWRDWTSGRQDRHTRWRWAAGATRVRGRTVGINVSTGMNASGPGENVVWWDGSPWPLQVDDLAPVGDDPAGRWRVTGHTDTSRWSLDFAPAGARSADENLLLIRSRYVQPVGTFRGQLPDPDGALVDLDGMPGVTEDHEALW